MKKDKKGANKVLFGIKAKLLIGFLIPLICIIIGGSVSYSLANDSMRKNYEDAMSNSMMMAMEYLDFGFKSATSVSEQLYYDTDLVRWATGAVYNEWKKQEIAEDVALDLSVKQKGNSFISNMYIIPNETLSVISTYDSELVIPGFYDELKESSEAVCLDSLKGDWIGTHKRIDEVLSSEYTDYDTEHYACSYIRPMTTKRASIVVDYSSEEIAKLLINLGLGKDSIAAFITKDGRELLVRNNEVVKEDAFSFLTQSYYTDAIADDAAVIMDYVHNENKEYLFVLSKSYENGSSICAMVPISNVNAGAATIKNMTILIVVVSWTIAGIVGVLIIMGISSIIKQLSDKLKAVSNGDLTVTLNTNRKDEFSLLVNSISEMISHSKNLIVKVLDTTENVSMSTAHLTEVSKVLNESNHQIAIAVDGMDQGINQQSEDTQNCLSLMDDLSKRISLAVDSVQSMNTMTHETKEIINSSMSTMDDLGNTSSDTTEATRNVISNIRNLQGNMKQVEGFVETINKIAEETSLLALNASIEAARAGEAGRGFAIVAQAISKLSEGTIEASKQIQEVMTQINIYTSQTVHVAETAEDIVSKQATTVNESIHIFGSINTYLESLVKELMSLEDIIENMEHYRDSTLSAIENISSVSEETAASVSVVNGSLKEQMTIVDNVRELILTLESRTKEVTEAINAFKIK